MGDVDAPVTKAEPLVTDDGVPIDTVHLAKDSAPALVLAPGFPLSWQRPAVWQIATQLQRMAGVVAFDFRGHGRSGGLCTMADKEIRDLDVAVAYARELGYPRVAAIGFSMGASIVLRYAGLVGGGLDAMASVSSPGWWYCPGTERVQRVLPVRIGAWVAEPAGPVGALHRARAAGFVVTGPPHRLDGGGDADSAV